jgi:hypothetical protein
MVGIIALIDSSLRNCYSFAEHIRREKWELNAPSAILIIHLILNSVRSVVYNYSPLRVFLLQKPWKLPKKN